MTEITIRLTVDETVDVAQLGAWVEAWIRDQWDGHGEPCPEGLVGNGEMHLRSVKAVPPASSKPDALGFAERHRYCGSRNLHEAHSWQQIGRPGGPLYVCKGKVA